ncbi:MAG: hypothetical protein D6767_01205, partial [Candidatus Hydrogenedentota bacterium]
MLYIFFIFILANALSALDIRNINTQDNEFSPAFYPDGKCVIFSSNRLGKPDTNLYLACEGEPVKPLVNLNSPYHDESPRLSGDGKILVFASDRDGSKESIDSNHRIRVSFDIYISYKTKTGWTNPVPIPGEVNSFAHERSPALNYDGSVLYFNRWPFGNIKKAKLYKAVLQNGKYRSVTLLPSVVNSGFADVGLVPAFQGTTIQGFYFASRRPGGFGGWDIYYTKVQGDKWLPPVHLPKPVNSPQSEVYLSWHNGKLYLASNRKGGKGGYDLYAFLDPARAKKYTVIVQDKESKKPLSLKATIHSEFNGQKIQITKKSNTKGKFSLEVSEKLGQVMIEIQKEGYLPLFYK